MQLGKLHDTFNGKFHIEYIQIKALSFRNRYLHKNIKTDFSKCEKYNILYDITY